MVVRLTAVVSGLLLALGALGAPVAGAAGAPTCQGERATIVSSASTVTGTAGRDVIVGTRSSGQRIKALGGDDLICASSGPDVLNGGAGADSLAGRRGADSLEGGSGRDSLAPGAGADVCSTDSSDTVVGECKTDTDGPVLSGVSVPTSVRAGGELALSFDVADVSGVNNAFFKISGASGWVTTWCGFGTDAPLVSGTPFAGTYAATCAVPATAVDGTYTLWLDAQDSFGSFTTSTQVDFVVEGGSSDAAAPVVSEASARLVPGDPDAVVIRWRAADETGVAGSAPFLALDGYRFADSTGTAYFDYGSAPTLVDGDALDGTYEVTLERRPHAPAGTYTLWISSFDVLSNKEFQMQPPDSPVTVDLP